MLGRTEPRLWTPPLRELTPDTSVGFDQIEFARDVLRFPLDPWQEWCVIHAGELLPDGRLRFRRVLVLVSRQNGKTTLLKILTLYWQFVEQVPLILGTSTSVFKAKEVWQGAVSLAESVPELEPLRPKPWTRLGSGEVESFTTAGSRYKIGAANSAAGRGLTVNRLVMDELREHHHYGAWDSIIPTMIAVDDAQAWLLSNAGSDKSVVLNDQREACLKDIKAGNAGERTALFEWSAEEHADPTDVEALAQANPSWGRRGDPSELPANARRAVAAGGEVLAGFKTEYMCIRVKVDAPAIDAGAWLRCLEPGGLKESKSRVALCLDVAPNQMHATLYAAAVMADGRTRVDFVQEWSGLGLSARIRKALPSILERIKPQALGWLPNGPAAALATDLAARPGWPPAGVTVQEIKAELPAVCMGFESGVTAGTVVHSGDPLLDSQVAAAQRYQRGDTWVFSRKGEGTCDALYAAAGAVHIARTLPPPVGKPRLVTVS